MCWEDVKINRAGRGRQALLPLTAASSRILPFNPLRTALVIMGLDAGTATVSFANPAVILQGANISTTSLPVVLSYSDLGALLQQEVFAVASGASNIAILEIETPRDKKVVDGG